MTDHHDHDRDNDRRDREIDLRVAHPGDELSALLDGELETADEARVRRHLTDCEPCRNELDEVAAVRRAVRGMPAVAAPPGFVDELVDRRHRATRRAAAVTLLAAALALVVGIVAAGGNLGARAEPAGAGGIREQVALVDRSDRLFPPTPNEASGEPVRRWDAGRPGPDAKRSVPAPSDLSTGDDEESVLGRTHEAGREMLDLLGG